jgi:hypothetical protein
MFYAALDVSQRSIAVCIIDHEGKVRLERSISSEVPDLIRCLREFGEPIHQVGLGGLAKPAIGAPKEVLTRRPLRQRFASGGQTGRFSSVSWSDLVW